MALDHEGPEPVYQQLAAIFRDQIKRGRIPAGRPVPSKKAIKQALGVSGGTVDRAMKLLKDEKLIYTVDGKGLFVAAKDVWQGAAEIRLQDP